MKKTFSATLVATLLLLTACSSTNNDTSQTDSKTDSKTVTVERGPILGAVVVDNDGQKASEDNDSIGSYTFETPPSYPINAYGGYIDVNRNGVIDAGEVENTIRLQANDGEVLTLLTSMLTLDDENTSSFLLDDLNLNSALTPGEDRNVSALSDAMYQYLIENNLASVEDINASEIELLKDLIRLRIEKYSEDDLNATEQEKILVLELGIEKLDDADADEANEKLKGIENAIEIIKGLPNMSDEQKAFVIDKIKGNSKNKDDDDDSTDDDSTDDDSTDDDEDDDDEDDDDEDEDKDSEDQNATS